MPFEVRPGERRGDQDARVALAIVEVDRDDEVLPAETLRVGEVGAAAVGKRVARIAARTALADSVGISEGEQHAGVHARAGLR